MKKYQKLEIEGAILDEEQLKAHMEKIAIQHTLKNKSNWISQSLHYSIMIAVLEYSG